MISCRHNCDGAGVVVELLNAVKDLDERHAFPGVVSKLLPDQRKLEVLVAGRALFDSRERADFAARRRLWAIRCRAHIGVLARRNRIEIGGSQAKRDSVLGNQSASSNANLGWVTNFLTKVSTTSESTYYFNLKIQHNC